MQKLILPLTVIGALLFFIAGCNDPGQNIDFTPGNSLMIDGPTSIALKPDPSTADTTDRIPATAEYRIVYATTRETYNWSATNGANIDSTFRYNSQHALVTFPAKAGTYKVEVKGSKYDGSTTVTVKH